MRPVDESARGEGDLELGRRRKVPSRVDHQGAGGEPEAERHEAEPRHRELLREPHRPLP